MTIHFIIIGLTVILGALAIISFIGSWGFIIAILLAAYGAYVAWKESKK